MKKIEITVSDELTIDAGTIEESTEQFIVHPPATPMIDQIIAYLDEKPDLYGDTQIQYLGVGLTCGGHLSHPPAFSPSSSPLVVMM